MFYNKYDEKVYYKTLTNTATPPTKAHEGDAGYDLYADAMVIIQPHDRHLVPTGIALEIPSGYEGCVRPRSGNALHRGYTVLNTPGTIDSNYRGEIGVIVYNTTDDVLVINKYDRIAQIVFQKLPYIELVEVGELSDSDRSTNGFGSTD